MSENLYIPVMESESLFEIRCSRAVAAFTKPLDNAEAGDVVGAELRIFRDYHDNLQMLPPNSYIQKTPTGYKVNNWSALSQQHPQREYLASSLMNLVTTIGSLILLPDLSFAIEQVSSSQQEGEYFSLGIFQGGGYIIADTAHDRMESFSWENPEPTQRMISEVVRLLTPEVLSAHARLSLLRTIPQVKSVLEDLYPFKWNDIDPLALSLDPSLSRPQK